MLDRRDLRQQLNEELDLYCYGDEDNPREWSLWRETDDIQLTPWMDLGPEGMIWVIWNEGEELMLVLEHRDDDASPPILRQALMHLPSGKKTGFVFAGDCSFETNVGIECVNMGNQALLMLTYPHDYETRDDLLGAALYDRQLRELVGPCITWIRPCGDRHQYVMLALRRIDTSVDYGVFDYAEARFVVPAEYDDIFEHQGRWICNRGEHSDLRDEQDRIVASHAHALYESNTDDGTLYAKRNGLWGRADENGRIIVEPYAEDSSMLDAEIKRYTRLTLDATAAPPLCLEATTLAELVEATGESGICIKYEAVEREGGGDGMLDISRVELPGAVPALLLKDRWGDLRLLVLAAPWRKQPVGTVLSLQGKSRVHTLAAGGAEDDFLEAVFAQTFGMF